MPRLKVLFLCTGNSCRSQMAEGWARHLKADALEAWSAGTDPHGVNPRAVRVMAEAGVDISAQPSKSVDALAGVTFDYVVTVCDQAHEELDPDPSWLHWSVSDPVAAGTSAAFDAVVTELAERIDALAGIDGIDGETS